MLEVAEVTGSDLVTVLRHDRRNAITIDMTLRCPVLTDAEWRREIGTKSGERVPRTKLKIDS
jgi:hypothetical protein